MAAFMVKSLLMQFHRWLGVALGLILGIVAITGAIMSFEDEIARAIDGPLFAPGAPPAPDLSPDQMVVRVEAAYPGLHVDRIVWPTDRTQSVEIRLAPAGKGARIEGQVDRATGQWLGSPSTYEFSPRCGDCTAGCCCPAMAMGSGAASPGLRRSAWSFWR
jgi:sulfite reductase (NADPH) flavoprotein alpha-component